MGPDKIDFGNTVFYYDGKVFCSADVVKKLKGEILNALKRPVKPWARKRQRWAARYKKVKETRIRRMPANLVADIEIQLNRNIPLLIDSLLGGK